MEILSLKSWRRRRFLTIRGMAALAHVAPKTVLDLEGGHRSPRPGTIRALSSALNIEPEQVEEFRRAMGFPSSEEESNER